MTKTYQALMEDRIFIGGADDALTAIENERADLSIDLRAEAKEDYTHEKRVHSPIVDDEDQQDESVQKAIDLVVNAYNEGKKVYFHCAGGSNRTGTVAIGTLLALDEAKTIEEAEAKAQAARPKINVKPSLKETLARLYPDA